MESPAYVLEFEKPLRELTKQLDELRQRSIETNVDVAGEIHGSRRGCERQERAEDDEREALSGEWKSGIHFAAKGRVWLAGRSPGPLDCLGVQLLFFHSPYLSIGANLYKSY
jgi:hypothetical protein